MANDPKPARTRKPRVNYAAEHAKLVQYCRISIDVMTALDTGGDSANMQGQITALKAVLRQLGETA